jgi:predicted ester cyclase
LSVVDEVLAEDFRFRGSLGLETCGRSDFINYIQIIRQAFPDFYNQIIETIAEDNRVVARLNYSGTHRGRIFEIDATGIKVSYDGVAIFAIGGGQLTSGWVLGDLFALMRQLQRADPT